MAHSSSRHHNHIIFKVICFCFYLLFHSLRVWTTHCDIAFIIGVNLTNERFELIDENGNGVGT